MTLPQLGPRNSELTYVSHTFEEYQFDLGEIEINYTTTGNADYPLFSRLGYGIEANLLLDEWLTMDTSAKGFLTLKILLSAVLVIYWKTAACIPRPMSGLSLLGVLIYTQMFTYGIYVFIST